MPICLVRLLGRLPLTLETVDFTIPEGISNFFVGNSSERSAVTSFMIIVQIDLALVRPFLESV
ncbi:hypothetical protein D3C85_1928130 [compost metagenome]